MSIDELLMDFAVSRRDSTIPIEFTNALRRFSLRIDDSDRVYSWTSPFLASGSTIPNGFHDSLFSGFHFLRDDPFRRVGR